jgi:hypothetical protein
MSKRQLALLAGAALVALAAGGAYAAIPDQGGVFHACAKKTYQDDGTPRGKGELRLIDHAASEECNLAQETHIHFNEKGQKGDQGEPGPSGPVGPAGANGVSVTSQTLSPGNTNCPNGGSRFTSASGDTYACNGADGSGGAGVTAFTATLGAATNSAEGELLRTLPNGLEIRGECRQPDGAGVRITAPAGTFVFGFGTAYQGVGLEDPQFPFRSAFAVRSDPFVSGMAPGEGLYSLFGNWSGLSVLVARVVVPEDAQSDPITYGPFFRVELMGREAGGTTCRFDGLISPLT